MGGLPLRPPILYLGLQGLCSEPAEGEVPFLHHLHRDRRFLVQVEQTGFRQEWVELGLPEPWSTTERTSGGKRPAIFPSTKLVFSPSELKDFGLQSCLEEVTQGGFPNPQPGRRLTSEVDCVEKDHHNVGRQLGEHGGDLPIGGFFHPSVDGLQVSLAVPRKQGRLCSIESLGCLQELLFDREAWGGTGVRPRKGGGVSAPPPPTPGEEATMPGPLAPNGLRALPDSRGGRLLCWSSIHLCINKLCLYSHMSNNAASSAERFLF